MYMSRDTKRVSLVKLKARCCKALKTLILKFIQLFEAFGSMWSRLLIRKIFLLGVIQEIQDMYK